MMILLTVAFAVGDATATDRVRFYPEPPSRATVPEKATYRPTAEIRRERYWKYCYCSPGNLKTGVCGPWGCENACGPEAKDTYFVIHVTADDWGIPSDLGCGYWGWNCVDDPSRCEWTRRPCNPACDELAPLNWCTSTLPQSVARQLVPSCTCAEDSYCLLPGQHSLPIVRGSCTAPRQCAEGPTVWACESDLDCYDGDPCTRDTCVLVECRHETVGQSDCVESFGHRDEDALFNNVFGMTADEVEWPGLPCEQTGTCNTRLSHQEAVAHLAKQGITLSSSGGCADRNKKTCTSLDSIRRGTIEGATYLHSLCSGCDLVVTGGTEVGHTQGNKSHYNGYKLDFRDTPSLRNFLKESFQKVSGKKTAYCESAWQDRVSGATYCRHGPVDNYHIDVLVPAKQHALQQEQTGVISATFFVPAGCECFGEQRVKCTTLDGNTWFKGKARCSHCKWNKKACKPATGCECERGETKLCRKLTNQPKKKWKTGKAKCDGCNWVVRKCKE
eukprot:TRINITY_DN75201_c0_g1_i1.p1 TRINITY_DN75201_c0_g1~~TRINITY_DN75201_c0_g1_i1.p1  ORF type:complete len:502 (+),score=22.73 TRINITY_DN75201_c0_g1_i1:83-1588(+)